MILSNLVSQFTISFPSLKTWWIQKESKSIQNTRKITYDLQESPRCKMWVRMEESDSMTTIFYFSILAAGRPSIVADMVNEEGIKSIQNTRDISCNIQERSRCNNSLGQNVSRDLRIRFNSHHFDSSIVAYKVSPILQIYSHHQNL